MHDHAAHAHGPATDVEPAPFLARWALGLGVIAVVGAATVKLAPAAFVVAIVGLVLSVGGIAQGAAQSRPFRPAVAGLFTCGITIVFWLLARGDIGAVAWGRSAWPDWLF